MQLAEYIKLSGMTQDEMADKLGVSRTAISHWATGARIPKRGNLQKIVEATRGAVTATDFYDPKGIVGS